MIAVFMVACVAAIVADRMARAHDQVTHDLARIEAEHPRAES